MILCLASAMAIVGAASSGTIPPTTARNRAAKGATLCRATSAAARPAPPQGEHRAICDRSGPLYTAHVTRFARRAPHGPALDAGRRGGRRAHTERELPDEAAPGRAVRREYGRGGALIVCEVARWYWRVGQDRERSGIECGQAAAVCIFCLSVAPARQGSPVSEWLIRDGDGDGV